jgi:hypothetical protein
MHALRCLAAILILAASSGCALTSPTPLQCGLDRYIEKNNPFVPYFETQQAAMAQRPLNVLVLSAGGEYGAYGTGFINEWAKLQNPIPVSPRDVTIVTGVSTGAIMATHVFLRRFGEIDALFRKIGASDIYEPRSFLGMLFHDSLTDDSGKHRVIRENLKGLVDFVADERKSHPDRRLLVGTVDLKKGDFLMIDLTKIASDRGNPNRERCYEAVVDGASAIPVFFSPIFVDDRILVDGGLRHYAFIPDPNASSVRTEALAIAKRQGSRKLFVIYHTDFLTTAESVGDNLFSLAGRTSALGLDELAKDTAYRLDYVAHHKDFAFDPYYLDARKAAYACRKKLCEPECRSLANTGENMFCHPFMVCLSDRGREDAHAASGGNSPWSRDLLTNELGSAPGEDPCK